jgi:hypothetical protein
MSCYVARDSAADIAGTPGGDGPLGLVVQADQAAAPPLTQPGLPQTDHNFLNNSEFNVSVSGVNGADLVAVGSSVGMDQRGGPVTVAVGVTGQGPAAASMSRSGDPLTDMTVALPSGTTATAYPSDARRTCPVDPTGGSSADRDSGSMTALSTRIWLSTTATCWLSPCWSRRVAKRTGARSP